MAVIFNGTSVLVIAGVAALVGVVIGSYLTHKLHKFYRKHLG